MNLPEQILAVEVIKEGVAVELLQSDWIIRIVSLKE